jgi:hypothetical protein
MKISQETKLLCPNPVKNVTILSETPIFFVFLHDCSFKICANTVLEKKIITLYCHENKKL